MEFAANLEVNDGHQNDSTLIYDEGGLNDPIIISEDPSVALRPLSVGVGIPSIPDTPTKPVPALNSMLMFATIDLQGNNQTTEVHEGSGSLLEQGDDNVGGDGVNMMDDNDMQLSSPDTVERVIEETVQIAQQPKVKRKEETGVDDLGTYSMTSAKDDHKDFSTGKDASRTFLPRRRSKRLNVRESAVKSVHACLKSNVVNISCSILFL